MHSAGTGRFCPYCGQTNPVDYRFCATCHRELPSGAPGSGSRPRTRRVPMRVAVVGVLVAIALFAIGEFVPVATPFSLTVESQGLSASTVYRAFPSGAPVTFHWTTDNGRSVTFSLVDGEGHALARSSGASGNFSFTSQGGSYGFQSYSWLIENVDVQGSYEAPWLAGVA